MAKSYDWLQDNPPEKDVEQRTIVATEDLYKKDVDGKYTVTETKEDKFTIAQLEEDLADIDRRIADLQEKRADKEAEIAEVKTALEVK